MPSEPMPEELEKELVEVTKAFERRTDPGTNALFVSVAMLLLVGAQLLPWVGAAPGWHLLAGIESAGPLPRLFTFTSLGFGLVVSAAALSTRSWLLAWICAAGCGISVINGVWSTWTRQVVVPMGGAGPGIGMILALVAMVLLAANWAIIALRR
jgi:hypothetical protein